VQQGGDYEGERGGQQRGAAEVGPLVAVQVLGAWQVTPAEDRGDGGNGAG
jgi:hypothetical protein